jgi:hypothetical protein
VGVFEGRIALICPGPTKSGMASTVVPPDVTWMDVPPSVVCKGNDRPGLFAGPKLVPNTEKIEPCAMEEFGKPTGTKLSALTTPRAKTFGCAHPREPLKATSNVEKTIRFIDLPPTFFGTLSIPILAVPATTREKPGGIRSRRSNFSDAAGQLYLKRIAGFVA